MLTPKNSFVDFIKLCISAGACSDEGQAVPVMEDANKGNGMPIDGTCADGLSLYLKDEKFPEEWALSGFWEKLGRNWTLNVVSISLTRSPIQ